MPKRNAILLLAVGLACLAAHAARRQTAAGRRFGEVLTIVEASHLDPVDGDRLFDAAVDAALGTLDEHSAYLRGDLRADLEAALDQQFGGVGLELAIDERLRHPVVASPVIDSPAWRAGVRADDVIEAIDGDATEGLPLRGIVARLRGTVGEPVTLRVATPPATATLDPAAGAGGQPERRDVTLVRELIRTETVLGDRRLPDGGWDWMLEGDADVGYVRITSFGERTAAELAAALAAVASHGPVRGLILDLRGNPGGLLAAAVEACDQFLDDGVIVRTRGRRSAGPAGATVDTRRATSGAVLADVPIAVLVDGLTASAAEIVAACLQDHRRATVVGSRTFGKGTVQSIVPLSDDRGLLKITTSEYLRPAGDGIHRRAGDGEDRGWGVSPDPGAEVAPTAESIARTAVWRRSRDAVGRTATAQGGPPRLVDPSIERALEILSAGPRPRPDLGGEEEAPGHDDDPAPAGE